VKDKEGKALKNGAVAPKQPEEFTHMVTKLIEENPILLFTKTYCPYSKKLKKMFDEHLTKDEYHAFDIDKMKYGKGIHEAVTELTGRHSVPNVFIGGVNTGGDEETEALAASGELKKMLDKLGLKNTF